MRAQHELSDVSVVHLHTEGPGPHLRPEMAGHFRHRALFVGPNARAAVNEGRADYVPVFLSDVPRLFSSGALPLDAVFVNATPPDSHGFCSLGTSVEAMHAAIAAARTVIVQFNRAMPRTLGESFIHVSEIDLAVEVDAPPYESPLPAIGEVERQIGAHVAELIPDGATLQLGIGAIPAATAGFLRDKQGSRDPHRDVHGLRRGPRGGRRSHGRPQGAQPRQDRDSVRARDEAALRVRARQPDGRDARRRLHERHARDPHLQLA